MAIDRATASILGLNDITGGDAGGEDVAVPENDLTFADGASITPDEDGGETIDFAPEEDESGPVDQSLSRMTTILLSIWRTATFNL